MSELRIDDFDVFFRELHGPCAVCTRRGVPAHACEHVEPFQWQRDLAREVCSEGWPSTIELPTASGKTAVLDIAVFSLALDDAACRKAPLRVFFVVDRRVVVDEAHRRALRIAARLRTASGGVTHTVAQRLRSLGGADSEPLITALLRGGIYREDGWARSPIQPLLAISTVDQVGSRLLGRGYGVGDGMKPLHQGLVAHDSLIILDEVHLSEPFRQTVAALQDYAGQAEVRLPRAYQFVVMSATPRTTGGRNFKLQPGHRDLEDCRPGRLLQRIEAHKWAELQPLVNLGTPPPKAAPRAQQKAWSEGFHKRESVFCAQVVRAVHALMRNVQCLGVVVNRVGAARGVFDQLREDNSLEVVLLTGRSRPLDRDTILSKIFPVARAGRERASNGRKLIVVATQCIEVGADFDFDGLVTECASFDALRQRFGRLDRLGKLGTSQAIIVARSDTLDSDPVYGEAIGKTWKWLHKKAKKPRRRSGVASTDALPRIDFGHAYLPKPTEAELKVMVSPSREAPVLLPSHLDAWAMTSPRPAVDPDIGLWLHGVSDEVADVQIVWRSDLPARQPQLWADVVALCPPGSAEAMLVPLYAVRAWLAHRPAPEIADTIANVADAGPTDQELWNQTAFALRWCGEDDPRTDLVGAAEVRPGDTLIVPSEWRGADEYGWLPNASDKTLPVSDLGDRVQLEQRGRATLRICTPICGSWVPPTSQICSDLQILVRQLTRDIEEGGDPPDVDGILALLIDNQDAAGWLREAAKRLRADRRRRLDMHPAGGVVLRAASRFPYRPPGARDESEFALPSPEPDFTPEDNASSFVSRPVKLRCHSLAVEELATEFARRCGLDPGLIADLSLAARLHDIGKADPRFQRWLYGGDEVAAALYDLRAKSGMRSRRLRERAREISGYPKGGRHELLSLAMVEPEVRELGAHDTELVLHLIGSHHGLCRPFVPHIDDQDEIVTELDREFVGRALCASTSKVARLARLDSGVSERYWSLLRKFGWLGLPYLEAIFRLADHRESDIEEKLESQGASE